MPSGNQVRPCGQQDLARGLWAGNRLAAFCAVVPLQEEAVALLKENPVTATVAERYQQGEPQYLICLHGYAPEEGEQINGALARALLRILPRRGVVYIQTFISQWAEYHGLMGFERAPWADSTTPAGTPYRGYQIDLRAVEQTAKVERLAAAMGAECSTGEAEPHPPLKEVAEGLRRMLKHFDRLHLHPELIEPLGHLIPGRSNLSTDALASRLQSRVRQAVLAMANGTEEERLAAQILQHAYVQRIGPHGVVAERLHLSVPTYYRHLRLAVFRLAQELIARSGTD